MTTSDASKRRSKTKEQSLDQVLPNAAQIEGALLGSIITYAGDELGKVMVSEMFPQMFYDDFNVKLCTTIKKMASEEVPIDVLTVTQYIKNYNLIEDMPFGEIAYKITSMTSQVTTAYHGYEYLLIVHQKYVQRRIIEICHTFSQKAYDDTNDVFDLMDRLEKALEKINPLTRIKHRQAADQLVDNVENDCVAPTGNIIIPMTTGWVKFDRIIGTGMDRIYVVAGAIGHGKTRFVNAWMTKLLKQYKDVAIQWNTFEDSAREIYLQWLSYQIFHTSAEIASRKFPTQLREFIKEKGKEFKTYDIEFYDTSERIGVIAKRFIAFCAKRPDKFNILIVDNFLVLKDREDFGDKTTAMEDLVNQKILECRQMTHGMIILVHHFNKQEAHTSRISTGYRPLVKDLKGSEGAERTAHTVLLLNNPRLHKDMMEQYKGRKKEILENMFIVEAGKTRGMKNVSNENLVYFFGDLDYNIFVEIPELSKEI